MKANKELILKALNIASSKDLNAIKYMITQYEKAIHFERYEEASIMELAIHKFICHHTNYAI